MSIRRLLPGQTDLTGEQMDHLTLVMADWLLDADDDRGHVEQQRQRLQRKHGRLCPDMRKAAIKHKCDFLRPSP